MEAFSLLKYWRGGGGGISGDNAGTKLGTSTIGGSSDGKTTIVTHQEMETDGDDGDEDDDGPFFDLEFTDPDEDDNADEDDGDGSKNDSAGEEEEEEEEEEEGDQNDDVESDGTDGEREFNFTLSSGSSNERTDQNLVLSPSNDLFFKGRLVPIEPTSLDSNGAAAGAEPNSKPHQFPVSLLKSATKFRVFMLGFKRSKLNQIRNQKPEANGSVPDDAPKQGEGNKQGNLFTVKLKVEEAPIVSLFTRDNSSSRSQKQQNGDESVTDEKRFSRDVMQKYLKKVKPLYVRVSRKYGEKMRFSGQLSLASGISSSTAKSTAEVADAPARSQRQGNIPAGLRVVCKHLGKSRSASSAVASASDPLAPGSSKRRDDSLLQQQDGIQSAIMHCKRSFNSSRDSESSMLPRSVSDPSHEKSIDLSRKSSDE